MEGLAVMNFKNSSVLVTGATGLVGINLIESLIAQGSSITVLVSDYPQSLNSHAFDLVRSVTVYNGDLADERLVSRAVIESECEYIFHLGAQTLVGTALKDPVSTFKTNIQGTWNILEASKKAGNQIKSITIASSDKAYGTSEILPYLEDFPLKGSGPYDVSKSCTDLLGQTYADTYGLPIGIARCGNIYGPGDLNWSRIVPGTIKSIFNHQQPMLRSDGSNTRDYIFVRDVVQAYETLALAVATNENSHIAYNFSNDRAYSVNEIYSEICSLMTGNFIEPQILNQATNEIQDQHLSSERAKSDLNWIAQFDLNRGLATTIPWYKNLLSIRGE